MGPLRRRFGWNLLLLAVGAVAGSACGSEGGDGTPVAGGNGTQTPPSAVKTCAPDCPVVNLAQGAYEPRSLVVHEGRVYFFTRGSKYEDRGVYVVPAAGGAATKLAQAEADSDVCKQIATDGQYVYFANHSGGGGIPSRLERVPVGGGPIEEISPGGTPGVSCIALDEANVYWAGDSWATGTQEDGIFATPKSGGAPVLLVKDERPTSIVVRGGTVYFSTETALKKVPTTGGSAITLAGQLEYAEWRIDVDGAFVYMADRADGTVARVAINGGPQEILAKDDRAWGLVVNGATLFWSRVPNSAPDNRIVMLELGAAPPPDPSMRGVPVAKSVGGVDVAADATSIYWASAPEGAIRKVAK